MDDFVVVALQGDQGARRQAHSIVGLFAPHWGRTARAAVRRRGQPRPGPRGVPLFGLAAQPQYASRDVPYRMFIPTQAAADVMHGTMFCI